VDLEPASFWFRSRNRLISWAVERYFGGARRVLEIGCGTGFVLQALRRSLPGASITASEVLPEGLAHAAARVPTVDFIQMDARAIPYEDEFDLVGAFDVVEHVEDDERVFREMARALVPGGGLLLTVPQHPFLWSAADDYAMHKRRYTRALLSARLREAGLRLLRITSFVSLLMPALLLSRHRQKDLSKYDPRAEFEISSVASIGLECVMSMERGLIRAGLNLPFGGSLLAIGRREA
jgi:SAM-dependent methyltransferase